MIVKRLLVWIGTFLGLGVGIIMVLGVFFGPGDQPLWLRLIIGAVGLYVLWALGNSLIRSVRAAVDRPT
ncbi:MAG: hypothetical protein ABIS86_02440 [Streptosporangiaceae bacterium]